MGTHPIFESDFDCLTDFRMFSRRNRGFIGTCFILIAIVLFGYGLYMYDLKSVKLTESEALRHRMERTEKKTIEKMDKVKGEKETLKTELESAKIELSKSSKALGIELDQRERREKEAIELGHQLQAEKDNRRECDESKEKLDHLIIEKDVALVDLKTQLKTRDEVNAKCEAEKSNLATKNEQAHTELDTLITERSKAAASLATQKDELEVVQTELKQYKSELMELKMSLGLLEVKGIKRDDSWMLLSEEDRGTILRGILDSDIYPNEFLEKEIAPTPENTQVDEPIDAEVVDKHVDEVEEKEEQPEEQAVPPAVQNEKQEDGKPDLDSQEEAVEDEDQVNPPDQ